MKEAHEMVVDRAKLLLSQAQALRDQVRTNIAKGRMLEDDVQMSAYNEIAVSACSLIPGDQVLGSLEVMPDATIKAFESPLLFGTRMPADMPSRRLDTHLTRLINRLEFVLGGPAVSETRGAVAGEVLKTERQGSAREIFESLDALIRRQPALPEIDHRDFAFIAEPSLRLVLVGDYVEAQRAFAVGAHKASAILSAGVLEGMLLDNLMSGLDSCRDGFADAVHKFRKVGDEVDWDHTSLMQLIGAAEKVHLVDAQGAKLEQGIVDFRDTVHPRAESRRNARARREEAELLLAFVRLLYRQLSSNS